MFNKETTNATGKVNVVLRDKHGAVKQDFTVDNLVVTTGLNYIGSRMKDATATAMSHMAVGTNNTAAALGNTALGAEVGSSRTALTSTTVTDNAIQYICTFGAGVGTGSLTEAGIFNASPSGGTMLARTVFSVINKGALDSMTVTWTVTIS